MHKTFGVRVLDGSVLLYKAFGVLEINIQDCTCVCRIFFRYISYLKKLRNTSKYCFEILGKIA